MALNRSAIADFIDKESAGGLTLFAAAALALFAINSPLAALYSELWRTPVEVRVGALEIAKPLLLWVNDGLMAIFFFLIGLEVKREIITGELSSLDKAALPIVAAVVQVPRTLDRTRLQSAEAARQCPAVLRRHSRWLSVAEWRALGIGLPAGLLPDAELATLFEPEGPDERAYLLTSNYHAILRYNCSNFYAMSVAMLSDAIARRGHQGP